MEPKRRVRWLLLLALAGCTAHQPDSITLQPVAFTDLPGWGQDHPAQLLPAMLHDCAAIAHLPAGASLGGGGEAARLGGDPAEWTEACGAMHRSRAHTDAAARTLLEQLFEPFRVSDDFKDNASYTGYYEPELVGDLKSESACATPLYPPPADLVQAVLRSPPGAGDPAAPPRHVYGRRQGGALAPYWTRAEIEDGAVDATARPLLWLGDPVEAFFLQIQGSGRVMLPNGSVVRVGYAGQNGQPFVDIGHLLLERGLLTPRQLTMQDVRQWLYDHPVESRAVMDANPSYVFFREEPWLKDDEGPLGALGVPLLPLRSLAVDPRFLPLGAPVWVDTRDAASGQPLQRLMLAQDVGGAIRGPARGDIFFGWGADAEDHAGRMWGGGAAYVLLPRPPAPAPLVAGAPTPLTVAYLRMH